MMKQEYQEKTISKYKEVIRDFPGSPKLDEIRYFLGYNLTELPPGKAQCPFHAHREMEEMFLILEGEGELSFGDKRYPLRAHDVIACPTGGPEVAHQIINTGATTMRYLAISNLAEIEICEYPDSGKVGVFGARHADRLRKLFRAETDVDYYDRETP